jgi:hypothetical protein
MMNANATINASPDCGGVFNDLTVALTPSDNEPCEVGRVFGRPDNDNTGNRDG